MSSISGNRASVSIESTDQLYALDAPFHGDILPTRPHPGTAESVLAYTGYLASCEVQRQMFEIITASDQAGSRVYAGIAGEGFFRTGRFIAEESEAERDGVGRNNSFFATPKDYWRELIQPVPSPLANNPFKYACRGWDIPAIVAYDTDELYAATYRPRGAELVDVALEAVNNGTYPAFVAKNDPDGSLLREQTLWTMRPGQTLESVARHVFYLVQQDELDLGAGDLHR